MGIERIDIEPIYEQLAAGGLVIVPNNRLRDAVEHGYAERQQCPVFPSPAVYGIDVWIRERWDYAASLGLSPFCGKQAVSGDEELFIWMEIIEGSLETYPLLNPEDTAAGVSRAYQLMKQWRLHSLKAAELKAHGTIPDIAAFLDWCQQFEQVCESRQLISLVDCIETLTGHLSEAGTFPLPQSIKLLNFFQPPPLYAEFFAALATRLELERCFSKTFDNQADITHHEFQDIRSEFQAAADWAAATTTAEPDAHIGILGELADDQRDELERLLNSTLNPQHVIQFDNPKRFFNSSHRAQSLLDEPAIHDAFLLFQLVNEEQDAEEFCRLLRSPFVLANSGELPARFELEKELRQRLGSRCLTRDLNHYANREGRSYHCPQLGKAMGKVREQFKRLPETDTPDRWCAFLYTLLETFDWPGGQLTAQNISATRRFQDALEQVATLTPVLGKVTWSKLLSRFRVLCSHSGGQQQFDARCQISLGSITEATGLQFDHLWLLNFNDQVWPPPISPSPFLPYDLQKELELPGSHTGVQLHHARETFGIVSNSVRGSLRSSHHRTEGEQEFRSSSFTRNFTLEPVDEQQDGQAARASITAYSELIKQEHRLEIAFDDACVPFTPTADSVGGHSVLSDQAKCPFHAFILHRLHAPPLPEFETGLGMAARGSAMHKALEFLFEQVTNRDALKGLTNEARTALCGEAAQQAINYLNKVHPSLMTPRFTRIERARIAGLLNRFLQIETSREEFAVHATEQKQSWTYRNMIFNLKIDRIDVLADGSLAVIDYKTGKTKVSPEKWLIDRPEDLQLPIYLTAMGATGQEPVKAVAIAHVNPEKIDYSGAMNAAEFHVSLHSVEKKPLNEMDWQMLTEHLEKQVTRIADEFRDGVVSIYPRDYSKDCRNNQIKALCRVPEPEVKQDTPREVRQP